MLTHSFKDGDKDVALIINEKYHKWSEFIGANYAVPIRKHDPTFPSRLVTIGTPSALNGKKPTKKQLEPHFKELVEYLDTSGIQYILCVDSEYFTYLTKRKFEESLGRAYSCTIESLKHLTVIPVLNASVVSQQPAKKPLLDKSLEVVSRVLKGNYSEEKFEFNSLEILEKPEDIPKLHELLSEPILAVDIETTGLRFESSEIVTVSFSKSAKDAVVICMHRQYHSVETQEFWRTALKEFFENYKGTKVYHNILFDAKFLARHLFMAHPLDYTNRTHGVNCLLGDDTMILKYLCENSTARVTLGLKEATKEYLGDYAIDVKDSLAVPKEDLAKYNGQDTCGTFWLYEKLLPKLKEENQEEPYNIIFKPSIKYLLNMMLNGLPLDIEKVKGAYAEVEEIYTNAVSKLGESHYVDMTERELRIKAAEKYNSTAKVKRKDATDFADLQFNPNSSAQVALLLFEMMDYEPTEFTEKGAPSTGRAIIEGIKESEEDPEKLEVLNALDDISKTAIILSTFLSVFEELWVEMEPGNPIGRLYGNQRLGSVISGRISANSPNFANMPSGSSFGKLIKSCFVAPSGWLYFGADYAALEDRVIAVLANDKAKLSIFIDGIDGHSLNAYAYYKKLMPDIDPDSVDSINSIAKLYPELRQRSKSSTFALNYLGTSHTLHKRNKLPLDEAIEIEQGHKELYKGVHAFADTIITKAKKDGYVTGAFGLKLRTPGFKSSEKNIVEAEGRTANNMVTQSYGMLTNRACITLQEKLERDGMVEQVVITNQIHDAIYGLCRATPEAVKWVNDNLIGAMVPDFVDNQPIHLEAEVDFGYSWKDQNTVPNAMPIEGCAEFIEALQIVDTDIRKDRLKEIYKTYST